MAVYRVCGFTYIHQAVTERHLKTQPWSDNGGTHHHSGVKASVGNEVDVTDRTDITAF